MIPLISIFSFNFQTSLLLHLLSIIFSFFIIKKLLKNQLSDLKILSIVGSILIVSIIGARSFYLLFEHSGAIGINELLTFKGMTFYGSFISGFIFLFIINAFFVEKKIRLNLLNGAIFSCLLSYGLLRFGCFLTGCCWGSITTLPWAVQYYHPLSVMPMKGIPVHPVQLYDGILSILFFAFLYAFRNSEDLKGKIPLTFFILFPLIRIFTETFRGDEYRGVEIFNLFSTSQIVSLLIMVCSIITFSFYKGRKNVF